MSKIQTPEQEREQEQEQKQAPDLYDTVLELLKTFKRAHPETEVHAIVSDVTEALAKFTQDTLAH